MSLIKTTREELGLLPAHMPEEVRDEATLNAFRILAEFKEAHERATRTRATPLKKESIKMMRRMYRAKEPEPDTSNVGEAQSLRMRILSASLFPNIYNKKMIMTNYGSE